MAPVEDIWYGTAPINGTESNVMWMKYTVEGETYTDFVPNGPWVNNNLALQTLAYLGLTPSTMNEDPSNELPTYNDGASYYINRDALTSWGAAALTECSWFVTVDS